MWRKALPATEGLLRFCVSSFVEVLNLSESLLNFILHQREQVTSESRKNGIITDHHRLEPIVVKRGDQGPQGLDVSTHLNCCYRDQQRIGLTAAQHNVRNILV